MSESMGRPLTSGDFTRGMLADLERGVLLREFGGNGLITEVIGRIDDGKEATVYLCRAEAGVGPDLLAAKVYRPQRFRAFSHGNRYDAGRYKSGSREERAVRRGTRTGRRMSHHSWIEWEWETLCTLADAGASVPYPLASSDDAILMEYLGSETEPAPQLRNVDLERDTARRVFEELVRNLEIFLDCHLIHGDLSGYNVLYADERPWIIDLPQAVDARKHPDGQALLQRDVENLCRVFAPHGIGRDPAGLAGSLWRRYRRGELGR